MHKLLKKLVIFPVLAIVVAFVSSGFVNYLSLNWDLTNTIEPVVSAFDKFKHIKYPLIISKIKNRNQLSREAKQLLQDIKNHEKRILKVYASASSLYYLEQLPIDPVEKEFGPINPIELATRLNVKPPSFKSIEFEKNALSLNDEFENKVVVAEVRGPQINWTKYYKEIGLEEELIAYSELFKEGEVKEEKEDLVKLVQSATERSSEKIERTKTDDLVFFSYQKEEEEDAISSSVMKAIEREFKKKKVRKVAKAVDKNVGGYQVTTPEKERGETLYKAKKDLLETEVITIGVQIDKGVLDQVNSIEFVPHYDKNERFYDESEGVIRLTSNLDASNYIYGTILGKDFVNMRTSIPLYLGGGAFEVPLIEKESFNALLDKEELNGLGSYLLVDLGVSAIDIDIDKKFEARTFLNEEFKITTTESSYKYVLYVGVEPGNVVIRYLDEKGSTHEKLSFLADREITFEYFEIEDSFTFNFETYELNPLSKKAKELAISSKDISLFGKDKTPKQIGLNSFRYLGHAGVKSANSYLEFNHLGDSIFAGMRLSNYVILPSGSFIESILSAEGLEDLGQNCMIQLNLSKKVKEILYDGEDRMGPMQVTLRFLDEDGVLSEEPSLLTKHAFILGTGQGVVNMRVEFLDGTRLVAQSFCSNGTYLVEQL